MINIMPMLESKHIQQCSICKRYDFENMFPYRANHNSDLYPTVSGTICKDCVIELAQMLNGIVECRDNGEYELSTWEIKDVYKGTQK